MKKIALHKVLMVLIFALLVSVQAQAAWEKKNYDDIEITDSRIDKDGRHFTRKATLFMDVKNNGDKEIANMAIMVSYFGEGDFLIQKTIIKNALNDTIPAGQTRSYRIELKGDFVNPARDQYPYSKDVKVSEFDVEVVDVKYSKEKKA